MIETNPILGTFLHSIGAVSAALCYVPQQKLKGWSWQTFWLVQAMICWFIAPVIGALLSIPELAAVLREAPRQALWNTFLLGMAYGSGGICFGLAIKHLGYSLTYAVAIGLSCVLGTLTAPIVQGTLGVILDKQGSEWVMGGIAVGILGIVICGMAGHSKEKDLVADGGNSSFSLAKGLPLCLIAGVLSALYGIAVNDAGAPIAAVAEQHGAGIWKTNVNYLVANPGVLLISIFYTAYLIRKNRSFSEFFRVEGLSGHVLVRNYLLSMLAGTLWYCQFLFYCLGHVRMGEFKFSSWAIHMIMLILFSTAAGLVFHEWSGCRQKTWVALFSAITILIGSVLILSYGNYLGAQ